MNNKFSKRVKNFCDKLVDYVILFGLIGLILGIINLLKGEIGFAKIGFMFFGIAAIIVVSFKMLERWTGINRSGKLTEMSSAAEINKSVTVLGIVVLLERPFGNKTDAKVLKRSIIEQQMNEFNRQISPDAEVIIRIAGSSLDDEAYIYGVCRSQFDGLSICQDNNEFLQRVAAGSFTASDGNHGKHFAFLDQKPN